MPSWLTRILESYIAGVLGLIAALATICLVIISLIRVLLKNASKLGLSKRCNQHKLESLCFQLDYREDEERHKAEKDLVKCGAQAVPHLLVKLDATDSNMLRERIVDVLCQIGPAALEHLLLRRKNNDIAPIVDSALVNVLPRIVERRQFNQDNISILMRLHNRIFKNKTTEPVLDKLKYLLNGDEKDRYKSNSIRSYIDPIVMVGAALALGQYPWEDVVAALGERLTDIKGVNTAVRIAIVESLEQTKLSSAIYYIQMALKDPEREVRAAACKALSHTGQEEAISSLKKILLPSEDTSVRFEAAKALGNIGGDSAKEALKSAYEVIPDDDDYKELREFVGKKFAGLQRVSCGEELI